MGTKDPRVDAYIANAADFARPILEHIRTLVHRACPDAQETMRWSFPHFDYKGMLCSMAAFERHCNFGFWKASLLEDPDGILATTGAEGMGHLGKIASLADLPSDRIMVKYIQEAAKLNDQGIKDPRAKPPAKKPVTVPAALSEALRGTRRRAKRSRGLPLPTSGSTSSGSPRRRPTLRANGGSRPRSNGWPRGRLATGGMREGNRADERGGVPPLQSASVRFFETQFERQVRGRNFALNPFETLALDYLAGDRLMFMRRERALALLSQIRERVRPGGRAIVNVLVEGTTYHDTFDPDHQCLFGPEELRERFAGWNVLVWRAEIFPAPRGTVKAFTTIIAEKPEGP